MEHNFNRTIYNFHLLVKDIAYLLFHFPAIIGLLRNKKINKAFVEKIMLVVTAVNSCPYCAWFHAHKAMQAGLTSNEIKDILNLQFNTHTQDSEIPALLFAQHYAETNRKPDQQMIEMLYKHYGNKTAKHILLIIRMIFFGNLSGNTFDAFISRCKGQKVSGSNVIFEVIFFLISAPILWPIMPYVRNYRKQ